MKKFFFKLLSTWEKCVSLNCGNFCRTTCIHILSISHILFFRKCKNLHNFLLSFYLRKLIFKGIFNIFQKMGKPVQIFIAFFPRKLIFKDIFNIRDILKKLEKMKKKHRKHQYISMFFLKTSMLKNIDVFQTSPNTNFPQLSYIMSCIQEFQDYVQSVLLYGLRFWLPSMCKFSSSSNNVALTLWNIHFYTKKYSFLSPYSMHPSNSCP